MNIGHVPKPLLNNSHWFLSCVAVSVINVVRNLFMCMTNCPEGFNKVPICHTIKIPTTTITTTPATILFLSSSSSSAIYSSKRYALDQYFFFPLCMRCLLLFVDQMPTRQTQKCDRQPKATHTKRTVILLFVVLAHVHHNYMCVLFVARSFSFPYIFFPCKLSIFFFDSFLKTECAVVCPASPTTMVAKVVVVCDVCDQWWVWWLRIPMNRSICVFCILSLHSTNNCLSDRPYAVDHCRHRCLSCIVHNRVCHSFVFDLVGYVMRSRAIGIMP